MPASLREFGMNKNMKPPEPDFVTAWRKWVKQGPPRCCFTCEHFKDDGRCAQFDTVPPKEFAEALDECEKWEPELPF
jgi:hypothetical protein